MGFSAMNGLTRRVTAIIAFGACGTLSYGQIGKITQQDWVTSRADAQRTSWIENDAFISPESMQRPGFELRWITTLANEPRQLESLSSGVVIGNLGFGSKPLSFIAGSGGHLFAVDNDTGVTFWQRTFGGDAGSDGTLECPGGISSAATRPASLTPTIPTWRGLTERGEYTSGVGAPGEGVPAYLMGRAGRASPTAAATRPARAGRAGGPSAADATARGRGTPPEPPVRPVVYALSSDGRLHTLGLYTGKDVDAPLPFLPPKAHATDLIALNDVVYAATMSGCGGAPDGVWALDLASETKPVKSWATEGGSPTGAPAFGTDGTLFVAIGRRTGAASCDRYENALVALDPKDLTVKDWFTLPRDAFVTPPVVLKMGAREIVASATSDGSIVLLDGASLGGPNHATALGQFSVTSSDQPGLQSSGLTTWLDSTGARWLALSTATQVSAMRLLQVDGVPAPEPGWTSRPMRSPLPPVVVGGVAFVLSSGEFLPPPGAGADAAERVRRSVPAVLYALDAATGRELWTSGKVMTSFVHGHAPWPGIGQLHVATFDGTVYAFGFAMERH